MKKLLPLLLTLAMMFSGCGQEPVETEPTSNQPETKTVYVHTSITRTDSSATYRTEYLYNDQDLLTDVVITNEEGEETQRYQVTCDENGNPMEWKTALEGVESSIAYRFDEHGHTLGTYAYSGDTLVTSTEYTWSGDLRISNTVKAATQGFEQRIEYTYDEHNRLIRQDQYVDGTLSAYAICTCDDQGRLLISQGYDLEGNPSSTITCTYEDNTETRVTTLSTGSVLQTQVLTYDEAGNLLSNTLKDGEGKLLSTETHTWKPVEVPADSPRASI